MRRLDERIPKGKRLGRAAAYPTRLEKSYAQALGAIANKVSETVAGVVAEHLTGETMTPELAARIRTALLARLEPLQDDRRTAGLVKVALKKLDDHNRQAVKRSISVDVPELRTSVGKTWVKENVALIRDIPAKTRERIGKILTEGAAVGRRHEVLAEEIAKVKGITARRAKLIARDQVTTLNARLTRDRHQSAGIDEYKWAVADHSKRRRSFHQKLDSQICRYDDPPMGGGTTEDERGNPGDGIDCDCQAIPVIPLFKDI